MKNLLRYSVLTFLIFTVIVLTGCEKDDNGPDKNALLTAHIWNFDDLSTTSADPDIKQITNMMAAFLAYSTLDFDTDGTFSEIWPEMDANLTGTWELNADGTNLTFNKGTDDETVSSILTLTSDVLELNATVVEEDYGNYDVTYRWVK